MSSNSLTVLITSAFLLLAGPTMAAEVKRVEVESDGRRIDIQSELVVDAPLSAVYEALLSYDQFDEGGDTFAESRYVESATDGTPRIYTRTEGCIWFFCKTIERTARLEVEKQKRIVAIAEPENSDAALSIESWTLTALGDATIIEYNHQIDTGFWLPPLLGSMIINRSVEHGTKKAVDRIENMANNRRSLILAQN